MLLNTCEDAPVGRRYLGFVPEPGHGKPACGHCVAEWREVDAVAEEVFTKALQEDRHGLGRRRMPGLAALLAAIIRSCDGFDVQGPVVSAESAQAIFEVVTCAAVTHASSLSCSAARLLLIQNLRSAVLVTSLGQSKSSSYAESSDVTDSSSSLSQRGSLFSMG